MNRRAVTESDQQQRQGEHGTLNAPRRDGRHSFTDEEWLTPMQIARKLGYATDKPIRNAIKRGELKASHAPCRRKLIIAESEVLRWIDEDLAFQPLTAEVDRPTAPTPRVTLHTRRAARMPTLRYEPNADDQAA